MNIFYCYSMPLKEYLKNNGILPMSEVFEINPNSGKKYWKFEKCKKLDEYLLIWKMNKIKAIEHLKSK